MRQFVCLLLLVAAARPAAANDLERLYVLAKSNDAGLEIARSARDAAIEARPQALAAWLPQVALDASATRERAGYDSGVVAGPQAANCSLAGGDENCYGTVRAFGASLSQTLWSFAAFSRLKEADFQAAAAEAAYTDAAQDLILRVAKAYFAILAASDQLTINRRERAAFAELLHQATVRAQTGVGPRSDVAQAQSFYDATLQRVIDAQNALDDANLATAQIIGADPGHASPLRESIPLVPPQPSSVLAWVRSAKQDNLAVRAARLDAEAAARDIGAERGQALPAFALTLSSSKVGQDAALGGDQRLDTIGVQFRWPLFSGGAVASAVRKSRALYHEAQARLDAVERRTETDTRAAFRGVVTGVARIAAARQAVESGRAAVDASRRDLEFDTGTEFDLLNAQNNYYAAVRAYDQARYDYLTSMLSLERQAGRLGEMDLARVDALLVESGS